MQHARRKLTLLVAVVPLLLGAAACGDDGGADPEAQPAPGVTAFAQGDFSDIPLPPRTDAAGDRSEEDGVVARSYFVRNRTPEEVLDFYTDYFDTEGVPAVATPAPAGTEAWRGRWLLDGRELLISATPAPTADDDEVVTQLSLRLASDAATDTGDPGTTTSTADA